MEAANIVNFGAMWGYYSNVLTVIGALVTFVAMFYGWKHVRCKVLWCGRVGTHKVDGTTARVCNKHHTRQHHLDLLRRHMEKYPDRLGHGESHGLDREHADQAAA
jgi:hypothetical protein